MTAKLAYYVTVPTADGGYLAYGPQDDLPADVAKQITNPSAWEGGEVPPAPAPAARAPAQQGDNSTPAAEGQDEGTGGIPPKGGAGSGKDAWAAYAAAKGVAIAEGAGRDDILAALEAAGVPTE